MATMSLLTEDSTPIPGFKNEASVQLAQRKKEGVRETSP